MANNSASFVKQERKVPEFSDYKPWQPTTPCKADYSSEHGHASASPSPSKRKKSDGEFIASPSSTKGGSKWSAWEDQLIKDSIVAHGEKGSDWHAILAAINDNRTGEEPRTINSLRLHWRSPLKGRMLDS
jgi:hypothetical protein